MSAPDTYVCAFLKDNDKDRYLASLVLPENKREAAQALFAFNADIAAIPARVSEPAPGEIRLQWWHDALSGTHHGAIAQNPLAAAFLDVIQKYALPTGPLLRLIAARRFDLYQDPMPDMPTFEGYAGETNAVIYQYAAMILSDGTGAINGDAAGHLGVAHALIGHLQSIGFNAARGRIFLPLDVFAANGINDQQLMAGENKAQIVNACSQLLEAAQGHLNAAEQAIKQLPKQVRPAFAYAGVLKTQMRKQAKASDPLVSRAGLSDWRKIAALAMWSWRNA